MAHEHWFDTVNKLLTRDAPRRSLLSAVAALSFGQRLGATDAVGKNGGRDRKKKGKDKKNKKPDPPALQAESDDCATNWPGTSKKQRKERKHCRFIRRQCDGDDPREFCIRDGRKRDGTPTKVAVCCLEGETCCGDECCNLDDPYAACCDGKCMNTEDHPAHCGSCGNACPTGEVCNLGQCECFGECDDFCPVGETLCGNQCVNTGTRRDHCGGCFTPNPNGLKCCNGNLCSYTNGVCCGSTCYPQGWPSCE